MQYRIIGLILFVALFSAITVERATLPAAVVVAGLAGMPILARATRERVDANAQLLPLALLCVWAYGSTTLALFPDTAYPQLYRLILGIGCVPALLYLRKLHPQAGLHVVIVLSVFGIALVALAPFMVDWISGKNALALIRAALRQTVLVADGIHPNVFAAVLLAINPFAMAWFLLGNLSKKIRIALGFVTAFFCIGLVLSQSRGALLGFVAQCAVLALIKFGRFGAASLLAVFSILLGIVFPLVNPDSVVLLNCVGFSTSVPDMSLVRELGSDLFQSAVARIEFWRYAQHLIWDFPVWGVGLGGFQQASNTIYPFDAQLPHAHNLFLQVAVDLGLPGLVFFLWWLFETVIRCALIVRAKPVADADQLDRILSSAVLAALAAFSVHGAIDAALWGMVKASPLLWLVTAIAWMVGHSSKLAKN